MDAYLFVDGWYKRTCNVLVIYLVLHYNKGVVVNAFNNKEGYRWFGLQEGLGGCGFGSAA